MGPKGPPSFTVRTDRKNGVGRVALEGELDMATVPVLEEHLAVLEQDRVKALVLNLRDLTFVDSTGLHAFLSASQRAVDNGHRFAIVGVTDSTRRLFEITGTERLLDTDDGLRLLEKFTAVEPDKASRTDVA